MFGPARAPLLFFTRSGAAAPAVRVSDPGWRRPQSFGVGLSNVGDDLFGSSGDPSPPPTVLCCAVLADRTGPRVGVSGSSGAPAGFPWRCWLADETSVSTYRLGRA